MFKTTQFLFIALLLSIGMAASAYCAELYEWTDKDGVKHYTDSKVKIPEEYRDNYETLNSRKKALYKSSNNKDSSSEPENYQPKIYRVPFKGFEGSSRRIIVNVTINNRVTVPFAVDTGSPGMIISAGLAQKLGLLEKKKGILLSRAGGIGGSAPAIRTIVDTVEMGGARDSFIPTTVIERMSPAFQGLIGMDFMSRYSIYIDHENNSLVLREIPPSEERPGGRGKQWWTRTFSEFNAYREAWSDLSKDLAEYERNTIHNTDMTDNSFIELKELADWQEDEASRLILKLKRFARDNSVPTSWWR